MADLQLGHLASLDTHVFFLLLRRPFDVLELTLDLDALGGLGADALVALRQLLLDGRVVVAA